MSYLQFLTLGLISLPALSQAVRLQDLPPPPRPAALDRRDGYGSDYSCLDLQSEEVFVWGAADADANTILGQLKVNMAGDTENVLSMERFKGMTTAINCSQDALDITFQDDATFEYAKSVWDWVNGADNHTFVMVAGTGDCGWNNERVPFTVFDLSFDEEANHAHLTANASDWTTAVHSYVLDVGQVAGQQDLDKRGEHDKDISIDFNHQFPINSTSLSAAGFGVSLACASCGTFGEFLVSVHIETEFLIPKVVNIGVQPRGVAMDIDPIVTLSGDIIDGKAFEKTLFTIPLQPISIPGGIIDLGPVIAFNAGVMVGPLTGSASIKFGTTISIPDNATATLDVLETDLQHSGWDPVVTTDEIVLDARLSGGVRAYINAEIQLAATAFNLGYDIALQIGPYIQGKLEAIANTAAACADDPLQRHFGVDFNPTYGVALSAVLEEADADPLLSVDIAAWVHQLPIICFPFGEPGNVAENVTIQREALPASKSEDQVLTGDKASAVMASATAVEASYEHLVPDEM